MYRVHFDVCNSPFPLCLRMSLKLGRKGGKGRGREGNGREGREGKGEGGKGMVGVGMGGIRVGWEGMKEGEKVGRGSRGGGGTQILQSPLC